MPGDCVKQVCRECARSTAGGFDSRTVCDHYQLIREQVSPFPVSDRVHASAQNQGITAPNALWHELQTAGRPSGRPICHPLPPHPPLHSHVFTIKIAYLIPITSCLSPVLSLICPTARPAECATHWDCICSIAQLLTSE